jgi:hypothetical protein
MTTRRDLRLTAIASRCRGLRILGALWLALAGWSACANPLGPPDPEKWSASETVGMLDRVVLRVHWFESLTKLREAAVGRGLSPRDLRGFSILSRNKDTGAYVCDVFVVKLGGVQLDDDRTVTFGHEVLHCFGLSHR